MSRHFLEIQFDASGFAGWGSTGRQGSISDVLTGKINTLLSADARITGCRELMDGVHARQYYVQLDVEDALPENFIYRLNSFLEPGIAIMGLHNNLPADASAGKDILSLTYHYYVNLLYDPFVNDYCYFDPDLNTDIDQIRNIIQSMKSEGMIESGCSVNSNNIELTAGEKNNRLVFNIVTKKVPGEAILRVISCILEAAKHGFDFLAQTSGFPRVPAKSLHLVKVEYPYLINEPRLEGFVSDFL